MVVLLGLRSGGRSAAFHLPRDAGLLCAEWQCGELTPVGHL